MAKGIALLLGPAKGKEPEPEEDDESPDSGESGDMDAHGAAAAGQFADALKRGDHAAMWDAFKTMQKLCNDEYGDEGDDEAEEK